MVFFGACVTENCPALVLCLCAMDGLTTDITTTKAATEKHKIPGYFGVLTALALLAGWAVYRLTLPETRHSKFGNLFHWPIDFRVYYRAGEALQQGDQLYAHGFVGALPFTYPPFAGALFRGLAFASEHTMAVAWQAASFLVLLLVIIAVLRERGYRMSPGLVVIAIVGLVASFNLSPVFGTIFFGQINIFLMGLVTLDFLRGGRARGRGIFTGIAAGIKLTPIFFALAFFMERRWRAIVAVLATFAVTVGIGFWGVPDAGAFWTEKVLETNRIGEHTNPGAQSLQSILLRMDIAHAKPLWAFGSLLIVVAFCIAARGAIRRGNLSLVMALGGVTAALISPFSWYHHWVYVVPLFFVLLDATLRPLQHLAQRISVRGRAGRGAAILVEQCGGFLAVAFWSVVFLPYASAVSYFPTSFHAQRLAVDNPWLRGMFVWAGIGLVVGCAVYYLVAGLVRRGRNR